MEMGSSVLFHMNGGLSFFTGNDGRTGKKRTAVPSENRKKSFISSSQKEQEIITWSGYDTDTAEERFCRNSSIT